MLLDHTGPVVGIYPDLEFKTRMMTLEPEELLLVYTDGVMDARDRAGEAFGKSNILSCIFIFRLIHARLRRKLGRLWAKKSGKNMTGFLFILRIL